jgi:hypothetical protein
MSSFNRAVTVCSISTVPHKCGCLTTLVTWNSFRRLYLSSEHYNTFTRNPRLCWTARDRIPVGARFSALVQTRPGAHPTSYTMGTGSFSGVKWSGCSVGHPTPSSAEVKERVKLYLYSTSGPSWPVIGWTSHLTFTHPFVNLMLHKNGFSSTLKNVEYAYRSNRPCPNQSLF